MIIYFYLVTRLISFLHYFLDKLFFFSDDVNPFNCNPENGPKVKQDETVYPNVTFLKNIYEHVLNFIQCFADCVRLCVQIIYQIFWNLQKVKQLSISIEFYSLFCWWSHSQYYAALTADFLLCRVWIVNVVWFANFNTKLTNNTNFSESGQ